MSYRLFLDDMRMPSFIYPKTQDSDWVIARDVEEFKTIIEKMGIPSFVSFDNDLGAFEDGTPKPEGKDAAKWMTYDKGFDISGMDFKVHSSNVGGPREDITSWINNWKKQLNMEKENSNKNQIRKEVRKILVATHGPIFSSTLKGLKESQEIRMKYNIPIPEDIGRIKNLLKQKGHKLFVVGGAVRDALLGKTPKDYDLATDALPDVVQQILSPFYKTLETGKAFGVINVLTPSGEYEIATFRKDIGAGRRPDSVEFTTIDQDVKRRDLTINALFYDIDTKEVVDLVGGIEDLKKGVVRTVGSAEERFGEDKLRILRAIRFAGRFGSDLDPATDVALQKDANLEGISGERIRDEFIKGIKSAKSTKQFLEMINKYGLFKFIFAGLNVDLYLLKTLGEYKESDYIVLLARMLKNNNLDALRKQLNVLKYTVDEIKAITFLISLLNLDVDTAISLKRAQKNSGVTNDQIRNFGANEGIMSQMLDAFEDFNFTVKSQDLIDQGFSGKALGAEIERREKENFDKLLSGN